MNLNYEVNIQFKENVSDEIAKQTIAWIEREFPVIITPLVRVPFNDIRRWAHERGIYCSGDPKTQTLKLQEEVGELAKAIMKNDAAETLDAIGDCVVVLTNLAHLCGLSIEDCIVSAYDVIKNRKGKMENGTFVKEQ